MSVSRAAIGGVLLTRKQAAQAQGCSEGSSEGSSESSSEGSSEGSSEASSEGGWHKPTASAAGAHRHMCEVTRKVQSTASAARHMCAVLATLADPLPSFLPLPSQLSITHAHAHTTQRSVAPELDDPGTISINATQREQYIRATRIIVITYIKGVLTK